MGSEMSIKKDKCDWKAVIVHEEKGYTYSKIDDFSKHTPECFRSISRFTPQETKFQYFFPIFLRGRVMNQLGVPVVHSSTQHKNKSVATCSARHMINCRLDKLLNSQTIDESISNKERLNVEIDEETHEILKFLNLLHNEKQVEVFVEFEPCIKRYEVTAISLMFPEGKRLLHTHHDVIFCDSAWEVCQEGYRILTVVVVDENFSIRLASMSIVKEEKKEHWQSFFAWIKG